ncbi:MAG: M23 family metallopeptidase [Vampirovibrionales bacterium]
MIWQGKQYPFYYPPATQELDAPKVAWIPIDPLENVGTHVLRIQQEAGKPPLATWQITVQSGQFGQQNIHVSKGAKGLEASAEESRLVEAWKRRRTPTLYADMRGLPWKPPVPQCMNSPFGVKRLYDGVFSGNYHKGIDQKSPQGQAIHPVTAGVVVMAGQYPLHGGTVAVDHGHGLGSIYIHMHQVKVKVGDTVSPTQVLGTVGSTGFAMGPHLHWGLYLHGIPLNPVEGWVHVTPC